MVRGERFKRDLSGNFISEWIVHVWNDLPVEAVEADTIITLKRHLEIYMVRKGLGKWDYPKMLICLAWIRWAEGPVYAM